MNKYLKITNIDEFHNGLQYETGIVEDIRPFNSNKYIDYIDAGGIYFTTAEYIPLYLNVFGPKTKITLGYWVREVEVPYGATVSAGMTSWKASKLRFCNKRPLWNIETWDWLEILGADRHAYDEYPLRSVSQYGLTDIADYFLKGAKINLTDSSLFRLAVRCGHVELVKKYNKLGINLDARQGFAIQYSIQTGNLEMVKFLVENGANISYFWLPFAIQQATQKQYTDVVDYVKSIPNFTDILEAVSIIPEEQQKYE